MKKRQQRINLVGTLVTLLLALLIATPLSAGGWVVITLDELPHDVIAGEALTVGFTVRQHGQTLINLSNPGPMLEAHHLGTGERIEADARQEGFTGHYRVEVIFPSAGNWAWQINPQPFPTVATMPPLTVHPGEAATPAVQPAATPLAFFMQLVQRWWAQLERGLPTTETQIAEKALARRGQDLFWAKGCITCHQHSALNIDAIAQSGPDLSQYDKTATFLRLWLADPAAITPTTDMPNLQLDAMEIEALAAFLTQEMLSANH